MVSEDVWLNCIGSSRSIEGTIVLIFENPFEVDSKISSQQKNHQKINVIKHSKHSIDNYYDNPHNNNNSHVNHSEKLTQITAKIPLDPTVKDALLFQTGAPELVVQKGEL